MKAISENLVEKIWREISDIDPVQANEEIQKIGQCQPELLAFVLESTEDFNPEAQELAIYLFFVVYRMFQDSGAKMKRIASSQIIDCYNKNESLFESFESPDKFVNRLTIFPVLYQPYVMRYVSDALTEKEGDTITLSEEEKGNIFLLLKTVVEILDKSA